MTGGIVTETIDVPATAKMPARVWICIKEDKPGGDLKAIYLEQTAAARCIQPEDSVYWTEQVAYWSPRSRAFRDYQLNRVGTGAAKRPKITPSVTSNEISPTNRLHSGKMV